MSEVCKNCGAELQEGAKFCRGCGEKVAEKKPESIKQVFERVNSEPDEPELVSPFSPAYFEDDNSQEIRSQEFPAEQVQPEPAFVEEMPAPEPIPAPMPVPIPEQIQTPPPAPVQMPAQTYEPAPAPKEEKGDGKSLAAIIVLLVLIIGVLIFDFLYFKGKILSQSPVNVSDLSREVSPWI